MIACGGNDGYESTCCDKLNVREYKWTFVAEMNEERSAFQIVSCGNSCGQLVVLVSIVY